MSDFRKWMKIVESVPAVFPNQQSPERIIKKDATVMVSPAIGGGTGRFMHSTPNGAMIDIKGVARELSGEDFSLPERDYEDPYKKGNDWFHMSQQPETIGQMNDKPEFRPGDMVKIADVYGSVIGPGFGVFVGYGTTGQDCIVLFDGKQIVVPIENVAAVLEQDAKDNFDEMDNDGNLSPMSLGSDNVKVEQPATGMSKQEPGMDQRDEFSKWMSAVEEALSGEGKEIAEDSSCSVNECGCGNWDCQTCFPDTTSGTEATPAVVIGGVDLPSSFTSTPQIIGGHDDTPMNAELELAQNDIDADIMMGLEEVGMEEEEEHFIEKPASGKGVKLGDIVQKTEFRKSGGQNSPLTYGEENLDEEIPVDANPEDYGKAGRYAQDHFGNLDEQPSEDYTDEDREEALDMISQIKYMQDLGLSKAKMSISPDKLESMQLDQLRQFYDDVMGNLPEATKPTKTKFDFDLDDLEDVLNPRQADLPATIDEPEDNEVDDDPTMSLPAASRSATQDRLRGMTPSDTMRDYMNRINPDAGAAEPDIPDTPENELVVRTASDVPAVISSAMQASGVQSPEWHHIRNLPGFGDRNIRGMGRQMFGMFTSTPVEQIQTIANVEGQGPNTDAEMRAVAGWLRDNAEDMGEVKVSHGMAIPGYEPDVREFRANGIRFHVVRDPMGQYIYAYPESTARLAGPGQGQDQGQLPGRGNMPRLREFEEESMNLRPTLFEQLKWDEEINAILKETSIDEEVLDESTLSKMLGKEKGGQNLVRWLHRRHKLSNEADLQPAPFSERLLWKEFKANPDNFVIVSAENGVAGVKPYEKFIKDRTAEFARKGKTYNPSGDSTLPYQIIAFTDDGQQVDPNLLRQPTAPGEEPEERFADPTVMKARMGKISGKDMQNPNNTFNLLADQIGTLKTVWVAAQAVERDKMKKRADMKVEPGIGEMEAIRKIFKRVRPVLKTLANQALSQIHNRAKRYLEGGNYEGAQKIAASGNKLKQFLATLDTSGDIPLSTEYGAPTKPFTDQIAKAIVNASGSRQGSPEYMDYLKRAASGSSMELKPLLDALRDNLVSLT